MLVIDAQRQAKVKSDKLLFADLGINFRFGLLAELSKANEKEVIKIDLDKVKVIDSSFCREAFVKLIPELNIDEQRPRMIFINVHDYVKQNIEESFTYYNKYCLVQTKNNEIKLVGKFSEPIADTVNALLKLKQAKAKDIGKKLEILELNTINHRLKSIFEMCIINRKEVGQESGGKEFIYIIDN